MFSFLNTLDVLPVTQVNFIEQTLRETEVSASFLLKAKTGAPGFIALNAWVAGSEPVSETIATEIVCSPARRAELQGILESFVGALAGGDSARHAHAITPQQSFTRQP